MTVKGRDLAGEIGRGRLREGDERAGKGCGWRSRRGGLGRCVIVRETRESVRRGGWCQWLCWIWADCEEGPEKAKERWVGGCPMERGVGN